MKLPLALYSLSAALMAPAANAESVPGVPVPAERQLSGVSRDEADAIIAQLKKAQQSLQKGKFESFALRSGSIASYEQTTISPREAFLRVPFDEVWKVDRVTSTGVGSTFRLAYAPEGLGQRYWNIEVRISGSGKLEEVTLTFIPPAPF